MFESIYADSACSENAHKMEGHHFMLQINTDLCDNIISLRISGRSHSNLKHKSSSSLPCIKSNTKLCNGEKKTRRSIVVCDNLKQKEIK